MTLGGQYKIVHCIRHSSFPSPSLCPCFGEERPEERSTSTVGSCRGGQLQRVGPFLRVLYRVPVGDDTSVDDLLDVVVEEAVLLKSLAHCRAAKVITEIRRTRNEFTEIAVDERAVELLQAASAKVVEFVAVSETADCEEA